MLRSMWESGCCTFLQHLTTVVSFSRIAQAGLRPCKLVLCSTLACSEAKGGMQRAAVPEI